MKLLDYSQVYLSVLSINIGEEYVTDQIDHSIVQFMFSICITINYHNMGIIKTFNCTIISKLILYCIIF
jgi:hypothetical protein